MRKEIIVEQPDFKKLVDGKSITWDSLMERAILAISKMETMYDAMIPVYAQAKGISDDEAEARMNKRRLEYFSDQFTEKSSLNSTDDRD